MDLGGVWGGSGGPCWQLFSIFLRHFRDFSRFGEKIIFLQHWVGFRKAFGRVWERFWDGFGKLWEPLGRCWALPGLLSSFFRFRDFLCF